MKSEYAMLHRQSMKPVNGMLRFVPDEPFEVRVLARAEGYALVRRKGCYPFVCAELDLKQKEGAQQK